MPTLSHGLAPRLCAIMIAAACGNGCRPHEAGGTAAPAGKIFLPDPSSFSGSNAMAEVEAFVKLGPKEAGTEGALRAAEYIADRLRRLHLRPELMEFEEDTVAGRKTFRNVICRIRRGGNALVVLTAHYDTKAGIAPSFQGANDSGSGVGILLELARCLSDEHGTEASACDVELAFVDGEECVKSYGKRDGLHGSCRHAQSLFRTGEDRRVTAVIVVDMAGDRDLTVTIPRNSDPRLISLAFESSREENAREKFSLYQGDILDDHVPYIRAGMPAIDIIDFEYGSAPGRNDYWHTPQDSLDKLSEQSLQIIGRVLIRMLSKLSDSPPMPVRK